LRCRLGLHRWHETYDHERKLRVKACELCDMRMSKGIPSAWAMGGGQHPPPPDQRTCGFTA
jgi:hypothetical protein